MAKRDYRSQAAEAWRGWYSLALWKGRRLDQLSRDPLCVFCLAGGRTTEAKVADHVVPHRGDWTLFSEGPLQSLCEPCHSITKQQLETWGYHLGCDAEGYPVDPNHPSNRR